MTTRTLDQRTLSIVYQAGTVAPVLITSRIGTYRAGDRLIAYARIRDYEIDDLTRSTLNRLSAVLQDAPATVRLEPNRLAVHFDATPEATA